MDASGTKSSRVKVYVEAIRQQWWDRLREEEEEETVVKSAPNISNETIVGEIYINENSGTSTL